MKRGAALLTLTLAACGTTQSAQAIPTRTAHQTAIATGSASTASTAAPATTSSAAAPAASPVAVHCDSRPPADRPLALGTLQSSPDVVVADVADPTHPVKLCSIAGSFYGHFISPTRIGYTTFSGGGGAIATIDLVTGASTPVVTWASGGFGVGTTAWSPDGKVLAYLLDTPPDNTYTGAGSVELHFRTDGQDRTVATLAGVPGRGVSQDNDDMMMAFSPDGQYFALVETFTGAGSGESAPFQVRRVDGTLVAAFPGGPTAQAGIVLVAAGAPAPGSRTMATWAGNSLYFRDEAGVKRWSPSTPSALVLPNENWIRPRASSDGSRMTYTIRDALMRTQVFTLDGADVALHRERRISNQAGGTTIGGTNPIFLAPTVAWYEEVRLCTDSDNCGMGGPTIATGKTFTFDLMTAAQLASPITSVQDVWPH